MVKIQTANGIYEVAKPGGKLGVRNMVLMARMATIEGMQTVPEGDTEDPDLIARIKAANEKIAARAMFEVFNEWAPEMLPVIVKSGPFKYDDMPGEDQLAIFIALSSEMKMTEDFFHVIPEPVS